MMEPRPWAGHAAQGRSLRRGAAPLGPPRRRPPWASRDVWSAAAKQRCRVAVLPGSARLAASPWIVALAGHDVKDRAAR
jgi:hypothetical protein